MTAAGWDIEGDEPRRRPQTVAGWLEDPFAIVGAAMVMALIALLPLGPVQAVLNLPLVLLLPGHALLVALGSPDRPVELAARLGLRVVTSLALVGLSLILVGSVLDLERAFVILTVWGVVVGAGLVAFARDRPVVEGDGAPMWTQSGVLLGLAAVVTTGLVVAGVALLPEPRQEPYVRLSVTGPTQAEGTPLRVEGTRAVVHLEVENGDDRRHRYGVVAAIDGGAQWESVARRIDAGDTWEGTVEGRLSTGACLSRLRISLTRDGEPAGVNPLVLYLRNVRGSACR